MDGHKNTLRDSDVLTAIKNGTGADASALAKALNISTSNAYYCIKQLRTRGRIDRDGHVVNVNAGDVARGAVNREDKKSNSITSVIECDYNLDDLTPSADDTYIKRDGVDTMLERLTTRGHSVILIGDAGTGKTKSAEQLSARYKIPFLPIACDDGVILKEYTGKREIVNGSTCYRLGLLTQLLQVPSVILFDEWNALPPSKAFFLHELIENRRFFIKDADAGRVVSVHKNCIILLACNPNGAKYSGTNKSNCALVDRCAVIDVPALSVNDVASAFDTGNADSTRALKTFYNDSQRIIRDQKLRVVLSLRGVKRIASALRDGDDVAQALAVNFYNCALLTASTRERDALAEVARVCFGIANDGGII